MELVGKRIFLLMILLSGDAISTEASHDQAHCKMEDFQVVQDFNEDRFQGKWYEVGWIILPWIKLEWTYYDYIHNNTKTDYGFSILAVGRWPFNATECVEPQYPKLYRTGENAKYLYEKETPNGLVNTTQWIVDTDYDNYALVIGCREVASNGTCVAPDGWLWTRCQNKPRKFVELMESRLSDFCLSVDQFHTTHHNYMECRTDIPASCPGQDLAGAGYRVQALFLVSITVLLLTISIFMNLH